ncbi:MAG: VCBS domain-containing protein [Desulfovibrio sp.]|nr:VCBS domain-containing protein [Desulfovibrio sp.]
MYTVNYTYELTKPYDNTGAETADYGKDEFTITVTDSDGDSASHPLVIAIEDDRPIAANDAVVFTVEEEDGTNVATTVTGNVTDGKDIDVSGGTKGDSSAGADLVGADANATPVTWQTGDADGEYGLAETGVPGVYNVVDAEGGTVGTLTLEADGGYTFVSNTDYEPTSGDHVITIPYTVTDADGDTAKANLTLTIQNVNDAPVITIVDGGDGTGGSVKEEGVYADGDNRDKVEPKENTPTEDGGVASGQHKIVASGTVKFSDAEDGDELGNLTLEGAVVASDGITATVQGDYGTLYMNLETGEYHYELDDRANGLNEGQQEKETFKLSVTDKAGVSTTADMTINVHGTNDMPTLSLAGADDQGKITFAFTDNEGSEIYNNKGFAGSFNITDPDADGAYDAADGSGAGNFSFVLAHSGTGRISNVPQTDSALEVGEPGQSVTIDGKYGSLTVNLETGEYRYDLYPKYDEGQAPAGLEKRMLVDDLNSGDSYSEVFTLTVVDAHGANHAQSITIDITGDEERPSVESFQHDVYEDGTVYQVNDDGSLYRDDDGHPVVVDGQGPTVISGNALEGSELGDGTAQQHTFTWDNNQGLEDGHAGTYGDFAITNGMGRPEYTYTLDNEAVQELRAGETREETFNYTYYDEDGDQAHGKVTITIHGANDQVSVTNGLATAVVLKEAGYGHDTVAHVGAATGTESTLGVASQTGKFTVHDPDANDDRFLSVMFADKQGDTEFELISAGSEVTEGQIGLYDVTAINPLTGQPQVIGQLTVTAHKAGDHDTEYSYTFTLNEGGADFLKQGDKLEYELTFTVGDGIGADVEQKVTIEVQGTNDQPVLILTNPEAKFDEGEVDAGGQTFITGSFSVADVDSDGVYVQGNDDTDANFSYNIAGANGPTQSGSHGGDVSYQGQYGTLTVHPDGTYKYELDFENRNGEQVLKIEGLRENETFREHFDVSATDVHGATSLTQGIDITLTGKDDDPVQVGGGTEGALSLKETGVGDAAHGGTGSSGYAANRAVAGKASDSSDATEAFKVLDLDKNDTVTLTLNDNAPNSVSTSGATTTYKFTTDYGAITVTGVKAADGVTTYNYTYALDNNKANSLSEGELVEKDYVIAVGDGSGGVVKHTVHTTIEGTNDTPVFTGSAASGTVRESGVFKAGKGDFGDPGENAEQLPVLAVTGKLTATDADKDSDNIAGSDLVFGLIAKGDAKDVGNIVQELGSDQATVSENSVFGQEIGAGLGTLRMESNGEWTFTLNDGAADKLAEGESVTLTFTATVTDEHGATAEKPITVTVTGTNDRPTLTVGYNDIDGNEEISKNEMTVTEDGLQTVGGTIEWADVDVKDMQAGHDVRISFTDADGKTTHKTDLAAQSSDNHIEIEGNYGTLYYDRGAGNGQGEWTYILDNTKAQNLPAGEPAQEVFTVMVRDANGAWVEQPLVVNVAGTDDDSRFDLSALNPSQTVIEAGVAPGNTNYDGRATASGDIRADDIDSGEQLTYSVQGKDGDWHELGSDPLTIVTDHGTVVITQNVDGSYHYVYTLDNDDPAVNALDRQKTAQDDFSVKVANQYGDEVEHPVNITIVGTNDRPTIDVISPILLDSTDAAQVSAGGAFSGRIATSDIDTGHVGSSEDGGYNLSVSAVDADGNLSSFVEVPGYGTFEVHKDGSYTFQLNDAGREALRRQGDEVEDEYIDITVTVRVTDPQGAYSEKEITFRLSGTEDAPVLNEEKSVLIEDGALSGLVQNADGKWVPNADDDNPDIVSGTLTSASVDAGHISDAGGYHLTGTGVTVVGANSQYSGWETVTTDYGTTYLNPNTGEYTFELNQNADAINALKPGESLGISVPVFVTDDRGLEGHSTISVTVHGTNDRPVLTAAVNVTLGVAADNHSIENWTARGSVVATDADNISYEKGASTNPDVTGDRGVTGDTAQSEVSFCFIDQSGQQVQTLILAHGSVTINAETGEYTYTFNVFDDGNYGADGKTPQGMSDTFTVYARDAEGAYSDPKDITVNIAQHDRWDTGTGGTGGDGSTTLTDDGARVVVEDYGNVDAHGGSHVTAGGHIGGSSGYFFIEEGGRHVQTVEGKDADGNVYGTFTINPLTGDWTFTLNNSTDLVQGMDGADSVELVPPTVGSVYGGSAQISLAVQGTADRPDFDKDEYNNQVTEDEAGHTAQTVSGKLSAQDVDKGDNDELTYGVGAPAGGQNLDAANGNVIHGRYGDLTVNPDGTYDYTIRSGVNVPRGEHDEVFEVTVTDNGYEDADGNVVGRLTDTATLTVRVTGLNTAPDYTGPALVNLAVTEDVFTQGDFVVAQGSIDLTRFSDNDGDEVHLSVSAGDGATAGNSYAIGQYGTLFIKPDGTYEYRLNNERSDVQGLKGDAQLEDTFWIKADDGNGGVTSIPITVDIKGTEDAPELHLLSADGQEYGGGKSLDFVEGQTKVDGKAFATDVDAKDTAENNFHFSFGLDGADNPVTELPAIAIGGSVNGEIVGKFVIDPVSGEYSFIPNENIEHLNVGEQIKVEAPVWVNADQANNSAHDTVVVTITGTNSTPGINAVTVSGLVEDGNAQVTGNLTATDADTDASLQFYVEGGVKTGPTTWEGNYGTLTLNPDGSYTYDLHNAKVQGANVDNTLHDVFQVVARDQYGATSDPKNLDFAIEGVNDLPNITGVTALSATESNTSPITSSATGTMTVKDVDDALDVSSFSVKDNGEGVYGELIIDGYDAATGKLSYHYELDNDKADSLGRNAKPTETFTILVNDGHGNVVPQVVKVTVNGVNDAPTLDAVTDFSVTEAGGEVVGTNFTGADVDKLNTPDVVSFDVVGHTALSSAEKAATAVGNGYTDKVVGDHGTLYYNSANGANKYVPKGDLQEGVTAADDFVVRAYDGAAYSAGDTLTVTVTGQADAPVVTLTGAATLTAVNHETGATKVSLLLTVVDPDASDTFTVKITDSGDNSGGTSLVGQYGTVSYVNGQIVYNLSQTGAVQALKAGDTVTETFTVTVTDSTGNAVDQTVTFTVRGTNDTPVISAEQQMAAVTEDSGSYTSSGSFLVTDADDALADLRVTVGNDNGAYGRLVTGYDPDTGKVEYTYTLDNARADSLGAGVSYTETFTIRVEDSNGGYTDRQVTVKVVGSNDDPVLTLTNPVDVSWIDTQEVAVDENASPKVTLNYAITDVDTNDTDFVITLASDNKGTSGSGSLAGEYGTLSVVNGQLVYTVDPKLGTGTDQQDVFTIKVADGHGGFTSQQVTFNVTSVNDAPTVDVSFASAADGILKVSAASVIPDDGDDLSVPPPLEGQLFIAPGDTETSVGALLTTVVITGAGAVVENGDGSHTVAGEYGSLTWNDDGSYTYTLDPDLDTLRELASSDSGGLTETFTVTVTDAEGADATDSFEIGIAGDGHMYAVSDVTHLYSGDSDNMLILGTDVSDRITVSGSDNVIYSGEGDDIISDFGSDNQILAGGGNDLIIFNAGSEGGTIDGGSGVDFLVGMTDIEDLAALGDIKDVEVLVVGKASSDISGMSNLQSWGITVDDGKVELDDRWAPSQEALPDNMANYTAYTYTNPNDASDTMTVLLSSGV